jgi:hypothetical protein
MADPIIIRNPFIYNEVFTGGTLTGLQITSSIQIDAETVTFDTSWDLPEADQLTAEDWMTNKATLGIQLIRRAEADTNLEFQIYQAIKTHIAALP